MKTLFTLCLSFVFTNTFAQQYPVIAHYSIDSVEYYEVSDCTPGSVATFYSSTNGGRYLGSQVVDSNGVVLVQGSAGFHPAMVLNNGTGGSGHVAYTDSLEFAIASRQVTGGDKTALATWAGTASKKDISFQIFKSKDGISYQPVSIISTRPGEAISPYSYTEDWAGAAVVYKVAVVSKIKGTRYMSPPMLLAGSTAITVFPTLVTDDLCIALPALTDNAAYSIINGEGKKVAGGNLTSDRTSVSLGRMATGAYFVTVRCGAEQRVVKVMKL